MDLVKAFRTLAIVEATSFLLLLVAAVIKRAADMPLGVEVLGPIHGVLFLAYVVLALMVRQITRWGLLATLGVLLGAVVPLGGFVVDRWMKNSGALATPKRTA